jgi:hypothetical protein
MLLWSGPGAGVEVWDQGPQGTWSKQLAMVKTSRVRDQDTSGQEVCTGLQEGRQVPTVTASNSCTPTMAVHSQWALQGSYPASTPFKLA